MTATAAARPSAPARTATSPFTGTATLLRLALRRDRVRLSVWLGVSDVDDGVRPQRNSAGLSG